MGIPAAMRRIAALGGAGAVLLLVTGGASQASAASCERSLQGAGPSAWTVDEADGEFQDAELFTQVGLDFVRDDAFDDYGVVEIDGTDYSNPNEFGCRLPKNGRETIFPTDVVNGVAVRPQLYVSRRTPLGRQFVSLRNTTGAPLTIDFAWDGDLGSDSSTAVHRTSSGDQTADAVDRWAVTCEDDDSNGCVNVTDDSDRDPELANHWEGKGQKRHSADLVTLADGAGNFDVEFSDVTIGAGKTVTFLQVVRLAPTIGVANRAARAIDKSAKKAGVFAKLSKRELKRLQNWKKPRKRRGG